MSSNLKDILSNLNPEVDQEALMKYLQGHLSAEQQHEMEKELMDNDFESDALEGLSTITDKYKIQQVIEQLNYELRKKTKKKKRFKEKLELRLQPWLIITVIVILALVVIGFFVIYYLKK
jgi:hypothetical protein